MLLGLVPEPDRTTEQDDPDHDRRTDAEGPERRHAQAATEEHERTLLIMRKRYPRRSS
jgi:hypothetical protein